MAVRRTAAGIISTMLRRFLYAIDFLLFGLLIILLLTASAAAPSDDPVHAVRRYTRDIEFDYINWTFDALWVKIGQTSIGSPYLFTEDARHQIVLDYLEVMDSILTNEYLLQVNYSDPHIADPQAASAEILSELEVLSARRERLAPLAEAVLESQLTTILVDLGLATGGQPIPPVAFHSTPLPYHLVISPRHIIQQDAAISLLADLTIDRQAALEARVDAELGVSSLIVPVGGIGCYPTMVMRTTDLNWLADTIAHEWIHNWLTLRPLGLNYDTSPELRTMNETTASIAGGELQQMLIARYYPELVATEQLRSISLSSDPVGPGEFPLPSFDYRAEMHTTRVRVDELLAAGEIDAAETYMEERRQGFWENGYLIRKLNQAYFAFYGAYADVPGGAAGEDPVGPAVRQLRAQSDSLADFLRTIAAMNSFQELQDALAR